MKKILLIAVSMLLSVSVFAHSGHTPFEFASIFEAVRHMFSSSYHVIAMLTISMVFIASAFVIAKKQQILSVLLMILGATSSMLGMGLLLS